MIRLVQILLASSLLFGCAVASQSERDLSSSQLGDESERLPSDFQEETRVCYRRWGALIEEWHEHGGGLSSSIFQTRDKIASDNQSRFAAIVRNAWASQLPTDARPLSELGTWPINDEEYRRVTASVRFTQSDDLGPACETTDWLLSFLWSEIAPRPQDDRKVRRLQEVPDNMEWESPFAQQWIKYWLFVRLDS